MSHLKIAAVAAAIALTAPAFADELEDGLAAINAEAAGPWTGEVTAINQSTGTGTPVDYDFTFVVTSDDGLDYAYWGPSGLTVVDYQGEGRVVARTWSAAGDLIETLNGTIALGEETGRSKAWTLSSATSAPDGTSYDLVATYTLTNRGLAYTQEASQTGVAGADKITLATGSWRRP